MHERNKFIRRARSGQLGKTQEEDKYWTRVADEVEQMDFSSFYHKYAADMSPDEFITFGGGNILYVGHVGIIDLDASTRQPYVIEAKWKMGVIQTAYDKWLQERGDNILVWHGRLKEDPPAGRSSIVAYAKRMIGRPYDFWNFDLSDETGFYCSKLVWRSVRQGAGIPLDDEVNPRRLFWYSPLQVMKSAHLQMLSSPGNYRNV
jgi:uncharacterized protein YycO